VSDAVFDTDLQVRSVVEASAGTGKTYALAGLFARAVIVQRLRVPQVLAVTYTVAATQELHERVRLRLQQAVALAQAWNDGDPEFVGGDAAETAMLRRLIHQALHDQPRESLPALRQRLARALGEMDLAAITTIHGFCQRVLLEHALDTGQPLLAASLETSSAASRERLAADLWRVYSRDAEGAGFLRRQFSRLHDLQRVLRDLLASEPLLPPAPASLHDPRPDLAQAWQCVAAAHREHGEAAQAMLEQAIDDKVLNASQFKREHVASLWQWLDAASRAESVPIEPHAKLHKYFPAVLEKGTLKAMVGRTPQSPLFATLQPCVEGMQRVQQWQEARDLQLLHDLRAEARRRDARRKQDFNVRDYDDLIGDLHSAIEGDDGTLAPALRTQFPCVLVDEFQDTDARQWQIFAHLFGSGGLVLVGDPKQAIYRFRGGDVNTYVAAAQSAVRAAPLDRNFRSRPCVIQVVNQLFELAPAQALGDGIAFLPTEPGGGVSDEDLLLEGAVAAALHFHSVPPCDTAKDWNKSASVRIAAELCAEAIARQLRHALAGDASRKDARSKQMRPLQPRDFAVLVRDHRQASAVRHALSLRGVPAVASGRESLYQGQEVQDVLALLLALRSPGDDRRLRAALATPLLGWGALRIDALDQDGDSLRDWQQRLVQWRTRWERHGPQAMLAEVVAENAERLLRQSGGERRLTNTLQLGELMQATAGRNLGTQGQLDALRRDMAHADIDNEAQQPRLESDAGRVQILTLHKSKGLEFPMVYLPFVGTGRQDKVGNPAMYTDAHGQRVRQWKTAQVFADAPSWDAAKQQQLQEEKAEDMRLLYVGLTRAIDALWVCGGSLSCHQNASLFRLLGAQSPTPGLLQKLGGTVTTSTGLPATGVPERLPVAAPPALPAARVPVRRLQRDWWIHSFSQLHRQQVQGSGVLVEARPADDELLLATQTPAPRSRVFAGARFGNVLHHALEHVDFAAWADHTHELPPPGQAGFLTDALNSQGYAPRLHEAGARELTPLVAATLNALLPEQLRLCDLPPAARINELEFHFALRGASVPALMTLLHAHGVARERRDFGTWTQLAGLMNGKIDLTYRHQGRVYVMDYKSNQLPAFDTHTLAHTMAASEYDLQALLYTLAVHRWMQLRMGARYDYERDFGGVRYVFCRGLSTAEPGRGICTPQFSLDLVQSLEALLVAPQEQAA